MAREQRLVDVRRALVEREADRADEILADLERWAPPDGADPLEETEHASTTRCADLDLADAAVRSCFPDRADAILTDLRVRARARVTAVAALLPVVKRRTRATVALGNSGEPEAVVALWKARAGAAVKLRRASSDALARLVLTLQSGTRPSDAKAVKGLAALLDDRTLVAELRKAGARAVVALAGLLVEPAIDGYARLQIVDYFHKHPDPRANDALLRTHPVIHPGGDYQLFALSSVAQTGDPRAAAPLIECTRLDGRRERPLEALRTLLAMSAARLSAADLHALASLDGITQSIYVEENFTGMFDSHSYEGEEPVDTADIRALAAAELARRG